MKDLELPELPGVFACWFTINDKQQWFVWDADKRSKVDISGNDAVTATDMGNLSDMNFILNQQLTNSLLINEWDFSKFRNPAVVLLEKL